jgi:hypothetical protein
MGRWVREYTPVFPSGDSYVYPICIYEKGKTKTITDEQFASYKVVQQVSEQMYINWNHRLRSYLKTTEQSFNGQEEDPIIISVQQTIVVFNSRAMFDNSTDLFEYPPRVNRSDAYINSEHPFPIRQYNPFFPSDGESSVSDFLALYADSSAGRYTLNQSGYDDSWGITAGFLFQDFSQELGYDVWVADTDPTIGIDFVIYNDAFCACHDYENSQQGNTTTEYDISISESELKVERTSTTQIGNQQPSVAIETQTIAATSFFY